MQWVELPAICTIASFGIQQFLNSRAFQNWITIHTKPQKLLEGPRENMYNYISHSLINPSSAEVRIRVKFIVQWAQLIPIFYMNEFAMNYRKLKRKKHTRRWIILPNIFRIFGQNDCQTPERLCFSNYNRRSKRLLTLPSASRCDNEGTMGQGYL